VGGEFARRPNAELFACGEENKQRQEREKAGSFAALRMTTRKQEQRQVQRQMQVQ
jgi:hypothetical protein